MSFEVGFLNSDLEGKFWIIVWWYRNQKQEKQSVQEGKDDCLDAILQTEISNHSLEDYLNSAAAFQCEHACI